MKATITQERFRQEARASTKSVVYVSSPLTDVASDWFEEHKVYALRFKSRTCTWSKLIKTVDRYHIPAIATTLKIDASNVKFSSSAGCSCGCSPGYNVKGGPSRRDIWIDVTDCDAELEIVKQLLPKFTQELAKEIAAQPVTTA